MATQDQNESPHHVLLFFPELNTIADDIYIILCASNTGFHETSVAKWTENIIDALRSGKKYVIFSHIEEAVHVPVLTKISEIHEETKKYISDPRFYYCTGSLTGHEDYNKFCSQHGFAESLTILAYSFFEKITAEYRSSYDNSYQPGLRNKKFLCYNRVERQHRVDLLIHMMQRDLIKDSYYSFDFTTNDSIRMLRLYNHNDKYDLLLNNLDMLPLVINRSPTVNNPVEVLPEDYDYFETSYVSIVTETLFHDVFKYGSKNLHIPNSIPGVFPSEKIFKPIKMRHPFILLSTPHFLKTLRDIGYKTFHPYIDESYDSIIDDNDRMLAIVNEITRLSKFTDEQWIEFTHNVQEIVEHNANVLKTKQDFTVTKNILSLFN
jgi:hypothetical protein